MFFLLTLLHLFCSVTIHKLVFRLFLVDEVTLVTSMQRNACIALSYKGPDLLNTILIIWFWRMRMVA